MQRVFGFIEQRFMFFEECPAMQRLFKAPAEPERDPVAEQAANNSHGPGLIEIDLAAADKRAQGGHQHGAGQQQPDQRQGFEERYQRNSNQRIGD